MARRRRRDPIAAIFQPKHIYLPGAEILRQVDIDRLADELEVDAKGAEDGKASIPPADGRSVSVKEREIVGRVREIWDETLQGAKRAYEGYLGRFTSLSAEGELDALLAEPATIAVKLKQAAREDRDRLIQDYEPVRRAKAHLEAFREREGITRNPRRSQPILTKVAFMGGAALLEFLVNTSIFAQGDAGGFLGAVTKVLVIPVANIGGCWLWTHWLARQVLVRNPAMKVVGVFGCLLTAVWLIGLNLAVAHWRDSADAVMSLDAYQAAFSGALGHPFVLKSFLSWGLFLIGCFAGGVAVYEGWAWNDPHPGYSRHHEEAEAAHHEWWSWRMEAMDRLEAIQEENVRRLAEAQRRAEIALSERPNLASMVASLAEDVSLFADHLRHVTEELGARYREANLRQREGERPTQFDKPLALALDVPRFPPLATPRGERQVAGKLSGAIQEITAAFGEACEQIPSASELDGAAR